MFKALYEYGKSHPEILNLPGLSERNIHYIVELDSKGNFVAVRPSERKKIKCPNVVGKTTGTSKVSNVLMEKASVSLGLTGDEAGKKLETRMAKRECFLEYFKDPAANVPEFDAVLHALETDDILEKIQKEALKAGVKPDKVVGFAVSGTLLSDMPAVQAWWADRPPDTASDELSLDLITGKPCVPTRLFEKIQNDNPVAAGGHKAGVSLISFNCDSFTSYGKKQGANAPMSNDTGKTVMDAFIHLGKQAVTVGNFKFLHWYDRNVPEEDDALMTAFVNFGDDAGTDKTDEDAANAAATELITSPLTGTPPAALAKRQYHIIIAKPEQSREEIREYMQGTYEDMYRNIERWFEDMSLVSKNGKSFARPKKLNAMLYAMLTVDERKKSDYTNKMKSLSPHIPGIMYACINGTKLPDLMAVRALDVIRTNVYSDNGILDPTPFQILKLWLIRNGKERKTDIMAGLNRECGNTAYHIGRLLSIYDNLQEFTMPGVKSTVLRRLYGTCMQNPALAIGNLDKSGNCYLQKIESPAYQVFYNTLLEEAWSDLGCEVPTRMSKEDKAYFALGRWHQTADLETRKRALQEELKSKKKKTPDNDEDED